VGEGLLGDFEPLDVVMLAEDRIGIATGCVYENQLTGLTFAARELPSSPAGGGELAPRPSRWRPLAANQATDRPPP
jgi:hypothetical protein